MGVFQLSETLPGRRWCGMKPCRRQREAAGVDHRNDALQQAASSIASRQMNDPCWQNAV